MPRKLTQSEFEKKIENFNKEYVAITPYIDYKTNVQFKHLKCGNIIKRRPGDFFQGKVCTKCDNYYNKEKWKAKFFKNNDKSLTNFELIGDWTGVKNKTVFKHSVCGTTFTIRPHNFRKNNFKCPKCSGRKIVDKNDFINIIKNEFNEEFELIGEYKNAKTEITLKHTVCSKEFLVKPSDFVSSVKGCKVCSDKALINFKKRIYNLVKDEYSVTGKYKSTNTNIDIKHNKCGYTWSVRPSNFLNGSRCPKCANRIKRNNNDIQKLISDTFNDRYTLVSNYKNIKKKIKIKDNLKGIEFECFLASLLTSQKYRKGI